MFHATYEAGKGTCVILSFPGYKSYTQHISLYSINYLTYSQFYSSWLEWGPDGRSLVLISGRGGDSDVKK